LLLVACTPETGNARKTRAHGGLVDVDARLPAVSVVVLVRRPTLEEHGHEHEHVFFIDPDAARI